MKHFPEDILQHSTVSKRTFKVMSQKVEFTLDGKLVSADPDQTIYKLLNRKARHTLLLQGYDNYRADEIAALVWLNGERVPAPLLEKPTEGYGSPQLISPRGHSTKDGNELLFLDQPPRRKCA